MQLADLDLTKTYTYADYFKWTFEERVELLRGYVHKMSPAPNRKHQQLSGEIYYKIRNFLNGHKCQAYIAPFDVRLPRKSKDDKDIFTVLQPDICVICDQAKLDDRGCIGAPDLVVEILSPGNNKKELKNKYELYEESGVREYWVVSPQHEWLMAYNLVEGRYEASRLMVSGDLVVSSAVEGLVLDLEQLFGNEQQV